MDNDRRGEVEKESTFSFNNDLLILLKFINEHYLSIGVMMFFSSVLAIHIYINTEKIPLSILSSELVVALPILLTILFISLMALIALIYTPVSFLLWKNKPSDANLIESIDKKGQHHGLSIGYVRSFLLIYWSIGLSGVGALVYYLLSGDRFGTWSGTALEFVLLVVANFAFKGLVALLFSNIKNKYRWETFFIVVYSSFVQVIILMLVCWIVIENRGGVLDEVYLSIIFSMVLLSITQLAYAYWIADVYHKPDRLVRLGGFAAVVLFMVCAIPPLNQYFVGYALATSAMGVRKCVVLAWVPNAEVLPELRRPNNKQLSIDLEIPISTQTIIYARPMGNTSKEKIILIPYLNVAKVMTCKTPIAEAKIPSVF